MGFESFIALCILSFTAAFIPGPNNALVAASGANFGFRRTFPHVLGISLGFSVMIFVVGLFLGRLFQSSLLLREVLRWVGVARFGFTKRHFFNGLTPRGGRWRLRLHRNSQPLMPPCKRP